MTNAKTTKRALLSSVISLVLCFSMLLGTTFAWFTDSVTSANNVIKSGNLDIKLEYWNGTEWVDVAGKSDILTNKLWEPGVTEVAYLRVENAGSLALKYQFGVNIVAETAGKNVAGNTFLLSDYIMFGVVENVNGETNPYATRESAVSALTESKKISAGYSKASAMEDDGELYLALVVYMPTTVGNEANHDGENIPQIDLGINIFATQYTYEEDSFNNQYDKDSVAIITSSAVTLPDASKPAVDTVLETKTEKNVELTLPAEFLSALAQVTDAPTSVALSHAEPKIDATNNVVVLEHIELIDENGDIIDLEAMGNDKEITVKFNVGNAFNVGDTVIVYHDGEMVTTVSVDANKDITYTATHFCEVAVGYTDGKIDNMAELENALKYAEDGDTILFGGDITSDDGILLNNRNLIFDLNGYTFTVNSGSNASSRAFKIIGNSIVTIKNGTIVAGGDINSGAYGTIRTEGSANVTLDSLILYNYRGGGLNVKVVTGTNVTINNCRIFSQYGGGVEASGGNVVLNNTDITQTGVYDNGWYSVALEINGGGSITVNSGNYFGSAISTDTNASRGNAVAFILSSGGTLNINGGNFSGVVAETAAASNFCGLIYADKAAVVNIYGGTFNSNGAILDMRNNEGSQPNPVANIYGGIFSANPTVSGLYSSNLIKLAEGCQVVSTEDAYVVGKPVGNVDELKYAITNAKDGDVILLTNDITVTDRWDCRYGGKTAKAITIDGLGNTLTFTGEVNDAGNYHAVLRLEGDSTVKNLTFDLSNAIGIGNRLRAISAKADLTVDNCNFIGNATITNTRGIIFGEGAGEAISEVDVVISNSTFTNWRCGVTDNENAKDAKSVVVTGCTFTNAKLAVSAFESITVVKNTLVGAELNITSYTASATAKVVAIENTLDANYDNVIGSTSRMFASANVEAQIGITVNAK